MLMKHRREYFRIRRFVRHYDRASGKFVVNIAYETAPPKASERVVAVAEGFGLGLDTWEKFVVYDNAELKLDPRDIVYITGDSGSGKSVLLRALLADLGDEAVDMNSISVDPDKPLIETVGRTVEEGLELLSRVGLNDAFLFLRTYSQLSDGQRYRYRVARLVESGRQWWIMDEFCATLDRDTAKIVAFNVQRLARALGKAVVVATTHKDLFEDLRPSVHVHKRFGREIAVNYYPNEPAQECSLTWEMRVEEGTTQDWKVLAGFHYRSHKIAALRKIFCLRRGEELCGVIVYCYPPPEAYGRRMVLPRMTMHELNEKLSIISRVVVHPKYRTIGLGTKLVHDTLPLAGTDCVELVAVMAKYNPFAEHAGMRKIAEQQPSKDVYRLLQMLEEVGFNTQLLSSRHYILDKLQSLSPSTLRKVRRALAKSGHPRFLKFCSSDMPYGHRRDYRKAVMAADLQKLAGLITICGFLLQTKVYLFWSKAETREQ
jgi:ABC-type transport system involved in cytochrome c biogenesis ATPase subunit/GNAT superfamily N-acetyltransferase